MPATNTTPATATPITALPFSITQDVSGGADTTYVPVCDTYAIHFPVWFTYTPPAGVTVIGIHFLPSSPTASYDPVMTVWVGTPPALTLANTGVSGSTESCWGSLGASVGAYASLNVTPGTTYYIQITDDSGLSSPDANLVLNVLGSPGLAAAVGSLLVPNDQVGYPAALLSATDGSVLQMIGLPSCEQGVLLPGGTMCLAAEGPAAGANIVAALDFYDVTTFTLQESVTSIVLSSSGSTNPLTSNRTNRFYWLQQATSLASVVRALNQDGTIVSTVWNLSPIAGGSIVEGIAASTDDQWLYFSSASYTVSFGVGRWNLVTNAFDGWVMPPNSSYNGHGRDLILLPDLGFAFFAENMTGGSRAVYHFSPAGALLHTFAVPGAGTPRLCLDPTDGTVVWVMFWPTGGANGQPVHFRALHTSDGSVATDVVSTVSEPGDGGAPQFGPSQSCPLILLPVAVPAPPSGPGGPGGGPGGPGGPDSPDSGGGTGGDSIPGTGCSTSNFGLNDTLSGAPL